MENTPMPQQGGMPDVWRPERSINQFPIMLAVVVGLVTVFLLCLLNTDPERLGIGNLVVIAGLGGIIGTSLSPLLEQRPERDPGGHLSTVEVLPITRLLVHITGGFGFAAA